MQADEEHYEDALMDSLLHEQARVDREQALREIDQAIMKDTVSHAAYSPVLNWKHMFISGAVAAALVLGFGYFLSMILLPGIHKDGQVAKDGPGESSTPLLIQYNTQRVSSDPKALRPTLPSGAPMKAPSMVFSNPLTGMGVEFDFYPDRDFGGPDVELQPKPELTPNKSRYAKLVDQEWCSPYDKPLSTFAFDVENASYANIRRLIQEGAPVPADAVRIEECINAFEYDYKGPESHKAFAVHTDLITCPWDGSNLLVKISVKGRAHSDAVTIAKDVKVLVEFNPKLVGSYRLVGYASPLLAGKVSDQEESDSKDVKAGHALTAFYEIIPARKKQKLVKVDPLKYQRVGSSPAAVGSNDEWLTLKLYHKQPQGDASASLEKVHKGAPTPWLYASDDTRFATAVVLFGMKLRGMDELEGITWQQVAQVAESGLHEDRRQDRIEFVELINALEARDR